MINKLSFLIKNWLPRNNFVAIELFSTFQTILHNESLSFEIILVFANPL